MNVYVDNAASTKMNEHALTSMINCIKYFWGNPSSVHSIGRDAAMILEKARECIANCIGAKPNEIYFTSGGTEADNLAINTAKSGHIITSMFEHHAVLMPVAQKDNYSLLPVSDDGYVELYSLYENIRPDTKLASIMMANNEIGTIQPIKPLANICRNHRILFHTDAVQAVGHIPVNVDDLGVDMLSASAHKFCGPKGIGFLYVRSGIDVAPLVTGGGQENGIRSGTENLPGIVGMAVALRDAVMNIDDKISYVSGLRDRLLNGVSKICGVSVNGGLDHRLPGNVNISIEGVNGMALLALLDQHGIFASSGAACSSTSGELSHVLKSIGLSDDMAQSSIRFSLSEQNNKNEIDYIIKTLSEVVAYLRIN